MTSICDSSFDAALDGLGDRVLRSELTWCLPADPQDTNSATTELEADCIVQVGDLGPVPACYNDPSRPCYQVTANVDCKGTTSQLELHNADIADTGSGGAVEISCLLP